MATSWGRVLSLQRSVALGLIWLIGSVAMLGACASGAPARPRIKAEDVWARPATALKEMSAAAGGEGAAGHAMSGTGAVFMRLVNTGREADRLVSAETDVADVVEIHETRMEGDVMHMQLLPDGLEIPGEGEIELKPGGYHIMLIGVKRDLLEDQVFPVVLHFEKSGTMTVQVQVRNP